MTKCAIQGLNEPKFGELDHYFRVMLYHRYMRYQSKSLYKDIIKCLTRNQAISTKEASRLWNVTEMTVSTKLKAMIKNGLVREESTNPDDSKKNLFSK